MTIKEITKDWLEKNGYDGLFNDECGWECSDLMPCGQPNHCGYNACEYKVMGCTCGAGHDFHIVQTKPEEPERARTLQDDLDEADMPGGFF